MSRQRPSSAIASRASAIGGASATNVPPARPRSETRWPLCVSVVIAWRSVERLMPSCPGGSPSGGRRGPADAELLGELALGGQARPGPQQAEPDRRAEPLHGLLEGRRRLDRAEDRRDGKALGKGGRGRGGHGQASVTLRSAVRAMRLVPARGPVG